MNKENLTAYEVVTEENLTDIHSTGWLLRHKKTGARVMLIENDDENKVFNIAFRTPPKDSTGVAHILEHSVLCGSREFPLKDPFVELVKGSLNTFLNAMTYPDKTCYPVASCNDKDFQNLMHVYLDAVFYPNIYKREEIFRQEGWHYEIADRDDELKFNGVVYNEMKGAFSSPDEVLEREIMNHLFPDTTYGCESGGDPKNIPDLTYENFLNFHRTYYHPSNSYIYLYGNMDMEEKLRFLDEHYLSNFDYLDVDSVIQEQKAFEKCQDVTLEYPGQIIKLSAYDKPASLGVTITKRGNAQVMAGQSMRYDLTVANTSNVPLESFFWHDKIPYDVARPTTLTTGTYSARLNYRILYKTNCNASYQVLASNLLTSCCVNANLVCASLSELYYCVLAYCVSLHLCALYSVNASRISHLDYRECLLCLTKSVRECKSYVVVATCAERNVCRTFLAVTSNVSECSVL